MRLVTVLFCWIFLFPSLFCLGQSSSLGVPSLDGKLVQRASTCLVEMVASFNDSWRGRPNDVHFSGVLISEEGLVATSLRPGFAGQRDNVATWKGSVYRPDGSVLWRPMEFVATDPRSRVTFFRFFTPLEMSVPTNSRYSFRAGEIIFSLNQRLDSDGFFVLSKTLSFPKASLSYLGGLKTKGGFLEGLWVDNFVLSKSSDALNFGSPVLDEQGHLIALQRGRAWSHFTGVSVIPIAFILNLMDNFLKYEEVCYSYLEGVLVKDLVYFNPERYASEPFVSFPQGKGVEVLKVKKDTPASVAGLQAGDRIVAINDQDVDTIDDFITLTQTLLPTDTVKLKVLVDQGSNELSVKLGRLTLKDLARQETQIRKVLEKDKISVLNTYLSPLTETLAEYFHIPESLVGKGYVFQQPLAVSLGPFSRTFGLAIRPGDVLLLIDGEFVNEDQLPEKLKQFAELLVFHRADRKISIHLCPPPPKKAEAFPPPPEPSEIESIVAFSISGVWVTPITHLLVHRYHTSHSAKGLLVVYVEPNSPLASSLQIGDVIRGSSSVFRSHEQFKKALGKESRVIVWRKSSGKNEHLQLGSKPNFVE